MKERQERAITLTAEQLPRQHSSLYFSHGCRVSAEGAVHFVWNCYNDGNDNCA